MAVHQLDVRKLLDPLKQQLRGLELLALHDERMLGVVLEDRVIELGDQRVRRPVPELEDRRHQPDPRHVVGEPVVAQEIECRGVRGGGARIGLRAVILVEQPHRYALASEQPCAEQADRSAARDQDAPVFSRHENAS